LLLRRTFIIKFFHDRLPLLLRQFAPVRTIRRTSPIAVWASLSITDRKAQRKSMAERLYRQNFTMEAIATQLGVTKMQISRDLRNCNIELQLPRTEKRGRPKGSGSGYRKGSKSGEIKDRVIQAHDAGVSAGDIAVETGVGERQISRIIKDEQIRRDALDEPRIERSDRSVQTR
jgi:hypothetical protein